MKEPVSQLKQLGAGTWNAIVHIWHSIPIWALVVGGIVLVTLAVLYSLTGKSAGGRDSHAGREQTRRAYRNALARYMAREDAEKIRRGEKVRRRWMQW